MDSPLEKSWIPQIPTLSRRSFLRAWMVGALVQGILANEDSHARSLEVRKIWEINSVRKIMKQDGKFLLWNPVRQEMVDNIPRPIASITKLMTALVVYDLCNERKIDIGGTQILLDATDKKHAKSRNRKVPSPKKYSIEQLLDMALIKSTNEATEALASGIISRSDFILRMNQKAQSLGMSRTRFDNPSGISASNVSTVWDLEKLTVAILNSPYPIGKTTQYEAVEIPQVRGGELWSANRITLWKMKQLWADPILTKTWFIRKAGRCEVTVFRVPSGNIYSLVLLGADTDGERKRAVWRTVADLVKKW